MPNYVVCTDGSLQAQQAVYFTAVCTDEGDCVTVLQITQSSTDFATSSARMQAARDIVQQSGAMFPGRKIYSDVQQSPLGTASAILEAYDGICDVIVVGKRGRNALVSSVLGSVSSELIGKCTKSAVLVVPKTIAIYGSESVTYICMCDGSTPALACIRTVAYLMHRKDKVQFVACVPEPAEDTQESGRAVLSGAHDEFVAVGGCIERASFVLEHGKVPSIAAQQRAEAADGTSIIAVGSRGLGTISSMILGSTTASLLRTSRSAVLVVKTPTPLPDALTEEWSSKILRVDYTTA